MAEVGILNLEIRDNSKEAAGGLRELAGALNRVKSSIASAQSVGAFSKHLEKLKQAMTGNWGSGTKFDNIARLKDAVNGLARNSTAQKLNDVAKAMNAYAKAQEKLRSIMNVRDESAFETISEQMKPGGMKLNLQQFGGKGAEEAFSNTFVALKHTTDDITQNINNNISDIGENVKKTVKLSVRELNHIKNKAKEKNATTAEVQELVDRYKQNHEDYSERLSRHFGIGQPVKSAEESWNSALSSIKEENEQVKELAEAAKTVETEFEEITKQRQDMASSMEAIRRQQESKFYGGGKRSYSMDETNAMSDNITKIDLLKAQLRDAEIKYNKFVNTLGESDTKTIKAGLAVSDLRDKIWEFNNEVDDIKEPQFFDVEALTESSQIDLMTMKYNGMKDAIIQDVEAGKLDAQQVADRMMRLNSLAEKIEELKNKQEEAVESTNKFGNAWEELKHKIKDVGIVRLVSQFGRIVRLRAMRYIIREISAGFSEGVQNVYQYSKAIGGSFYQSMDKASSALLTMKNSIGAAAAPLIQQLIPYLQMATNAVIQIVNWFNQFVSLLSGQATWTHAVPATTSAFNDQANAAHGAANAVKDLLADWDELNIIQSQTGGGSGSGAATQAEDYLNMFEQVAEFDNRVKRVVSFLRENLDRLKTIAASIGAILLGWKLSQTFAEMLPFLAKAGTALSAVGTIVLTLSLVDLSGNQFMQTGEPGWFMLDALGGAVGAVLAGELVSKLVNGTAGEVTRGFMLILEGAINIRNAVKGFVTPEQEGRAWALAALGAVQAGIGAGILAMAANATITGALLTGGIVTLAAMTIAIPLILDAKKKASYRTMAINAFSKAGEDGIDPQMYLIQLQLRLDELTKNSKLVVDTFMGFDTHSENFEKSVAELKSLSALVSGSEKLTKEDAEKFKEAWDIVLTELGDMSKISYETIYAGINEAIANGSKVVRESAVELRLAAIDAARITQGAVASLSTEMDQLQELIFAGQGNAVVNKETGQTAIERYTQIYEAIARQTASHIGDLQKEIEEGAVFDFNGEDDAVTNALAFIQNLGEEHIKPTMDAINEQLETEKQAVEEQKKVLHMLVETGTVTPEQEKAITDTWDKTLALLETRTAEQLEEVNGLTQTAFQGVFNSALEGFKLVDQTDQSAVKAYVDNVFWPIVNAITAAGGEIPDEVRKIIMDQATLDQIQTAFANENGIIDWVRLGFTDGTDTEGVVNDIKGWMIRVIGETNADLADLLRENDLNPLDYITDDMRNGLIEHIASVLDPSSARKVLVSMFPEFEKEINKTITDQMVRDLPNMFSIEGAADKLKGMIQIQVPVEAEPEFEKDPGLEREIFAQLFSSEDWLNAEELENIAGGFGLSLQELLNYVSPDLPPETLEKIAEIVNLLNETEGLNLKLPAMDIGGVVDQADKAASAVEDMTSRMRKAIQAINGLSWSMDWFGQHYEGGFNVQMPTFAANGAFPKSGDLVMANENGNFEMMGRMGNQPVVANNQQIVDGISKGVAGANGDVVSELRVLSTLMQRMLSKEFVARSVPSSSAGRNNARSADMYSRVTG